VTLTGRRLCVVRGLAAAIAIQVAGTDSKGNAVAARLDADYPLATPPPAPPLP